MTAKLRTAFEATSFGYSPDRVVADPELNQTFLSRCRELGIHGSDAVLNHSLLNLRKRGGLRGLRSKRSSFSGEDQYRFAAEIAARFIERRDQITVDDIICDPVSAHEFDELARGISPGFTSLEYRWAALNLRKARRLKPEILGRVVQAESVEAFRCLGLDITRVPSRPGLYVFFTPAQVLYIGEAESLNNRIRKHLDHSDNKGLARWLWEQGSDDIQFEIHVLPAGTPTRIRRAPRDGAHYFAKPRS